MGEMGSALQPIDLGTSKYREGRLSYAQAMQLITQLIGKDALVAAIRLLAKQSSEEAQAAS